MGSPLAVFQRRASLPATVKIVAPSGLKAAVRDGSGVAQRLAAGARRSRRPRAARSVRAGGQDEVARRDSRPPTGRGRCVRAGPRAGGSVPATREVRCGSPAGGRGRPRGRAAGSAPARAGHGPRRPPRSAAARWSRRSRAERPWYNRRRCLRPRGPAAASRSAASRSVPPRRPAVPAVLPGRPARPGPRQARAAFPRHQREREQGTRRAEGQQGGHARPPPRPPRGPADACPPAGPRTGSPAR